MDPLDPPPPPLPPLIGAFSFDDEDKVLSTLEPAFVMEFCLKPHPTMAWNRECFIENDVDDVDDDDDGSVDEWVWAVLDEPFFDIRLRAAR